MEDRASNERETDGAIERQKWRKKEGGMERERVNEREGRKERARQKDIR